MDRLLVIDPNELVFDFELGQRCSSFVNLKNVMFTMPVAFKVAAASGKKYTMKPSQGVIPPAGRVTVEITLNPQSALPDQFPVSADKFTVKSLVVPGGSPQISNDWFESRKNFVYNDTGLKAVFKGTCIVQALLTDGSMEQVREVLELGVDSFNCQDRPLLQTAIANGRPEMVQLLLEFGASPEGRDRSGRTALHDAAACGQPLIAELLLANGADPTARTDPGTGWTPLHFAAHARHADTVRVLLARSPTAAVNATAGPESRTPLHVAASKGDARCLRLLLEAGGADVDAATVGGQTPLHVAAAAGDVAAVEILVQRGATRRARDRDGRTPFDEAVAGGWTDLMDVLRTGDGLRRAARNGDVKGVRGFLKNGARVDGGDESGWTALHCAAFKGHLEVVRLLVERYGAEVNAAEVEGYSPLMCAVEAGQCEVVRYLMNRGADVDLKSSRGVSAVELGNLMGEENAVGLLLEGGARGLSFSSIDTVSAKMPKPKKIVEDDSGKLRKMKGVSNSNNRFESRRLSSDLLAC